VGPQAPETTQITVRAYICPTPIVRTAARGPAIRPAVHRSARSTLATLIRRARVPWWRAQWEEPLVVQSLVVELCPCSRYRSRSPKKRGVQAGDSQLYNSARGSEPFDLPVPARARRRMHRHRSADEPTSAPAVRHHERLPSTTLFNDTDRILRLRRSGRGVAAAAPPRVSQSRRHLLTVCGESAHGRRYLSTRVDPPPQPYVRSLPKPKRSG
jgi:hypothetical protein